MTCLPFKRFTRPIGRPSVRPIRPSIRPSYPPIDPIRLPTGPEQWKALAAALAAGPAAPGGGGAAKGPGGMGWVGLPYPTLPHGATPHGRQGGRCPQPNTHTSTRRRKGRKGTTTTAAAVRPQRSMVWCLGWGMRVGWGGGGNVCVGGFSAWWWWIISPTDMHSPLTSNPNTHTSYPYRCCGRCSATSLGWCLRVGWWGGRIAWVGGCWVVITGTLHAHLPTQARVQARVQAQAQVHGTCRDSYQLSAPV